MKTQLENFLVEAKAAHERLNALVKDKQVRIVSNYNGQPFGRSKRSLRGEIMTVTGAHIDPHWGVYLRLKGERCSILASEVEWL